MKARACAARLWRSGRPPAAASRKGQATKVVHSESAPEAVAAGLVVVRASPGPGLAGPAAALDQALGGALAAHLKASGFKGKAGETALVPTFGRLPAGAVLVVGGEDPGPGGLEALRRAAGTAAKKASAYTSVALALGDAGEGSLQAAAEGFLLGAYRFDRYKSEPTPHSVRELTLLGAGDDAGIRRAEVYASATAWARDVVNEPAGARPPGGMAALIAQHCAQAGVDTEVLDEGALEAMGMNGILGVGRGSSNPPRLVVMRYSPPGAPVHLGLVGKGITFDSGGLSLKPAEAMETMKTDCSGAAAVVAAVAGAARLGAAVRITAVAPLAENMPGGRAIKPGDVIRHYGGRTSEVLNTDAEGRLVLADALAWMAEQGPDAVVDAATLTGGMVVALGKKTAGFFASDDALAAEIEASGARTGESVWRMPLSDELRKDIDSEVADVKNTGGRWGSPIFGALFLKDFAGPAPWAHLDIAGPARSDSDDHYLSKGATGTGTRLLIDWMEHRAKG